MKNDAFLKLAAERYSVRKFSDEPVAREDLDRILEAARLAPTACNNQPQKIFVCTSAEALEKFRRCTSCHFHAPVGIVVCADRERSWKRGYDGQDSDFVDASIVTTHMMLEAAALGLGTTWVMWFDPDAVRREFTLPDSWVPVALLPLGHPAEDAAPAPRHGESREMTDMVTEL